MVKITPEWDEILKEEFNKPSYLKLREFLKKEYETSTIFPDMFSIFNALKAVSFNGVKVVILGQDPYHEKGQAMGLAFSVPKGIVKPPSLVNIFKEITAETGAIMPDSGDLTGWAKQGVLLLNTCLTVKQHQANSHRGKGWEEWTDGVIKKISSLKRNVVFLLWGANARSKKALIDGSKHLILEAVHPSPLSAYAGFFGCGHFTKTNDYLKANGLSPIDWSAL